MQMKPALALVIPSLFLTSPALSQSDLRSQQQTACEDDAYRLCPDEIPDEARITSCLARQKSKLSPGCRAMFRPSPRHRAGR
ncbi:MAG: cysteine rich repeat-containing protein [Methylocella sp.]